MCCNWIQKSSFVLAGLTLLSLTGCYSMNGYMMNASGVGYYEQGNYAMASQEFQTALASSPRNADYMANLARTRMKMGDQTGAEQLYQQALTIAPSHQPSYHGYSELLLAQNRSQDALRMMNSWAATQPYIAESHVELAWLQRELGQHDSAAESLQTALQVNPNHATALAHLGQYYHDTGNSTQAVALYQQALRADWNQPEVHSRLAMAAEAAGASHPMGEIAMSRGMHPGSVARQQQAFGPPPAGVPQVVGGTPFNMNPNPAVQQPYGTAPAGIPFSAQMPVAGMQAAPFPAATHYQPNPSMAQQSAVTPFASLPGMEFSMPPATTNGSFAAGVTSDVSFPAPQNFSNTDEIGQAPVPDPAFSNGNSSIPVTSVSSPRVVENDVPEVEAF